MATQAPNKRKDESPRLNPTRVVDRRNRRDYLNYSTNALDLTHIVHARPRNSGAKVSNDSQQHTVPRIPTIDLSLIGVNKDVKEENKGSSGPQVGEFMSMCKQLAEKIQNKKLLYRAEMLKCSNRCSNTLESGPQDMASGAANSYTNSIEFESSNRSHAHPQNEMDKASLGVHSTDSPSLYSHDDINAKTNTVPSGGCILQALPRPERREVRGNVNYTFNRNLALSMAKRRTEPISAPRDIQDNIDPISVVAQPTGRTVYAHCAIGSEGQPQRPTVCGSVVSQPSASNRDIHYAGNLDTISFEHSSSDRGISASILRQIPPAQNRQLSYESSKSGADVIASDHVVGPPQGRSSVDGHFLGDDGDVTFADNIRRNIRAAKAQYDCTSPIRNVCTKFDRAFNDAWNSLKEQQASFASQTSGSESGPAKGDDNVKPTGVCSGPKWNILETFTPVSAAEDNGVGDSNFHHDSNPLQIQGSDTECRPADVHVSGMDHHHRGDKAGIDDTNDSHLNARYSTIANIYNSVAEGGINYQNEASPCCAVTRRIGALTHLPSISGALVKGLSNYSLDHLSELSKVAEKCSLLSGCMHEFTDATPQGLIPWHLSPLRSNPDVDTPREVRLFFSLPSSSLEKCEYMANSAPESLNYVTNGSSHMHLRDTDWALLGRPRIKPNTRVSGHE